MTTSADNGEFPQLSEAQAIGSLAVQCFGANHPTDWIVGDMSGDADFGFDFFVQVAQASQIKWAFKVQLKGTKSPQLNASEDYFSIALSASNVRFYQNTAEPILLVLADISVNPKRPKDCPLYHVWIHDELKRFNRRDGSGLSADKKYVTFQVPKVNALENDTDLAPSIIDKVRIARTADALHEMVERNRPNLDQSAQIDVLERIPEAIFERGLDFFNALVSEISSPWVEPKVDSLPWFLTEAIRHLKSGKIADAEQMLVAARAQVTQASLVEQGEMLYIEGRIHAFQSEDEKAKICYLKAMEIAPLVSKHTASWAEMELRSRFNPDEANIDFSDVIAKLTSTDPLVVSVKVRTLAAERRYDEAVSVAHSLGNRDKWGPLATVYLMSSQFGKAIAACDKGLLVVPLRDYDNQLLTLLRTRAKFYLATNFHGRRDPDAVYPISGSADTNIEMLKDAWNDTVRLIDLLRAANWPPNTDFITDFWGAMAGILNKQQETLPILKEAARARSSSVELQAALELIAMQCQDFTTALAANAKQPESTPQTLRRLHLLHLAKKDSDFVDLLAEKITTLDRDHILFGGVLAMGTFSAERIVRFDLVKQWEEILVSTPSLSEDYAVQRYFSDSKQNRLTKGQALERLEQDYEKFGRPLFIGIHVFHELDSTVQEQAKKVIAIAELLENERKLGLESLLHIAQALTTLGRWNELLELSSRSLLQFENHERFRGIEALALDRLGRSAEALASLQQLIDAGIDDPFAVNTYLNIVVRSGFTNDAIRSIQTILSQQTRSDKKLQCLQLLFNLVYFSFPENARCIEILLQIGDLVDQSKEEEEGSFLVKFITATQTSTIEIEERKLIHIRSRMDRFFEKFPNSNILKRGLLPENGDAGELIDAIKKLAGWKEEQQLFFGKVENQLRTGSAPFPYAWRPKNVLQNVRDLPTLWEIGKRSTNEENQYHLTMVLNDFVPARFISVEGRVPLLDLTSLLVLQDLDLLNALFEAFPKIAIGQATITELNDLIRPMSGSVYRIRCQRLQERLKNSFSAIEQPYVETPKEASFLVKNWETGEIKELVSSGRYMLYSDDVLFRIYCQIPTEYLPAICTLDLLAILEEKGYLTEKEVTEKISLLYSWNVDLIIQNRHLLAAIPSDLLAKNRVDQGVELLHASTQFTNIYNVIWDIALPYQNLLSNMGVLARDLILNPAYKSHHIAAFLMMWNTKACLRPDIQQTKVFSLIVSILQITFVEPALNEESTKKLVGSYIDAIQSIHGSRMDENIEAKSIDALAKAAARDDIKNSFQDEKSLGKRLSKGFTPSTADSDRFNSSYASALIAFTFGKNDQVQN